METKLIKNKIVPRKLWKLKDYEMRGNFIKRVQELVDM